MDTTLPYLECADLFSTKILPEMTLFTAKICPLLQLSFLQHNNEEVSQINCNDVNLSVSEYIGNQLAQIHCENRLEAFRQMIESVYCKLYCNGVFQFEIYSRGLLFINN